MAHDDWAIVVGVQFYPGLTNLAGSVNDAQGFYDWVISNPGGAVPPDQVALIVSDPPPYNEPFPLPQNTEPKHATVQEAFDNLVYVADAHANAGNGRQVGRRLYIYMSGHGCAPRVNDTALLAANATRTIVGYHILGRLYADWFLKSNYFEEVMLLMDCCRESYPQVPPNIPPYIDRTGADGLDKSKLFYGFATKWSRLSRERQMSDGRVHGVFTFALLEGLKGAACDPTTGQITAATLGDYLYTNMKKFLRPEDLQDADIPKDPDIDYDKNPAVPFVISTVPIPQFKVTINLPDGSAGKKVDILNNKFQPLDSVNAIPPLWVLQLNRGTYLVQILADSIQKPFEVTGAGEVNVTF
jgi:hypothetical protein